MTWGIVPADSRRYLWLLGTLRRCEAGLPTGEQRDGFNAIQALITFGLVEMREDETGRVYWLTDEGKDRLDTGNALERSWRQYLVDGDRAVFSERNAEGMRALVKSFLAGENRTIVRLAVADLLNDYASLIGDIAEPQTKVPPAIIVDTREQKPLEPGAWCAIGGRWTPCPIVVQGLPAGDYTVFDTTDVHGAAHHTLLVERKSPQDLLGSLTSGLERLRSELLKAAQIYPRVRILVECWPDDFWRMVRERVPEGRVEGRVRQLSAAMQALDLDYGAAIVWTGSREGSERWIGRMAQRITAQLKDPKKRKELFERGLDKVAPWMVRGEGE